MVEKQPKQISSQGVYANKVYTIYMQKDPAMALHIITKNVAILSRTLSKIQFNHQYYYDKLMQQSAAKLKKIGSKKLLNTRRNNVDTLLIRQSIQLLQTCIQGGQRGETHTYMKFNTNGMGTDSDEEEEAYETLVKDILENVTYYSRQCTSDDGKSDVPQITHLIAQLNDCVTMGEQINQINADILNKIKFETMNLRELSRDVAQKNNMQPYDLATQFEYDRETRRGGKRRRQTRRKQSKKTRRPRRK